MPKPTRPDSIAGLRRSIRAVRRDLAQGEARRQRFDKLLAATEWLSDLGSALRWFARWRVWVVPTRRWAGPKGSARWPLPRRKVG